MAGRVPALSAVIPVYNSALSLPDLVARLQPVLSASANQFEIVFVDDDSKDDSWRVLTELCVLHRHWIRAI